MSTQSFEGAKQRCLFTTDVRAGTGVRVNVAGEITSKHVWSNQPGRTCVRERLVHDIDQISILTARVDVASLRPQRVSSDQHPFNQQMRITLHQVAIFECSRF